ncbi:Gmad2 immunoglobulin-like domain-containing protein [Candidatus Nomurabacteria bacterium]|nr:Gmad2 immunoglobulin-like domain-containing protein [Candidatus Nomurabacteria bacterium]
MKKLFTVVGLVAVSGFGCIGTPSEPMNVSGDGVTDMQPAATSFQDCVDKGYPVMESYPRQCNDDQGNHFVEKIEEVGMAEIPNLIELSNISPGDTISSPVNIEGKARGYWYFEAQFDVTVQDGLGVEIGSGIATALSDWMTEDYVPFSGTISFVPPSTPTGTLILHKANPSGEPVNDDELEVSVIF